MNTLKEENMNNDYIKKIEVSSACVACGSCVMITDLLKENPNGRVSAVEPAIVTSDGISKITEAINSCPVKAISLIDAGLVRTSGKEGLEELKKIVTEKLVDYKIGFPNAKDYEFDKSEVSVPTAYGSGEYRYEYKSDDKAVQAGLREFDRVMYSQRKAVIQQLLIEYKTKKLRKYSYYEKEQGNFYYDVNQSIQKFLKQVIAESKVLSGNKISLPSNFDTFEVVPEIGISGDAMNRELFVYKLRHIEELWFVQNIMNELEALSWYDSYIDTDDMEDHRGKDVYCYKNVSNACSKFGEHILNEFSYVLNGSDGVRAILESPINRFGEAVQKEVKKKADILISAIEKNVWTSSETNGLLNSSRKENSKNNRNGKKDSSIDGLESRNTFKNRKITYDGHNYILICPHCGINKIVLKENEYRILGKNIHLKNQITCELCDGKLSRINDVKIIKQPKKIVFICPNIKCRANVEVDGENCIENGDFILFDKAEKCASCLIKINEIQLKDIIYKK